MRSPEPPTDPPGIQLQLLSLDIPDAGYLQVLILADDPLVRTGLASFFSDTEGYVLVGATAVDCDLEESIHLYNPDVTLWDAGAHTRDAGLLSPLLDAHIPVLALVSDEESTDRALEAGAQGVLLRTSGREMILSALLALHHGLLVADPALKPSVFSVRTGLPEMGDLTPREHEVLLLVAEGLPNKGIADRLAITEHTVKFHVAALFSKLGAQSRTEAVVIAARKGILTV